MSLIPSSAGIERLFSSLSWIKNKYRNRLTIEKLEKMAIIRASCLSDKKNKEKSLDSFDGDEFLDIATVVEDLGEQPAPADDSDSFDPLEEIVDKNITNIGSNCRLQRSSLIFNSKLLC